MLNYRIETYMGVIGQVFFFFFKSIASKAPGPPT